ncbi:MAG: ATP-binding protein [Motiliproteus sp.]
MFEVIRTETKQCERHGIEYQASTVKGFGPMPEITNGCPECQAEALAAADQAERVEQAQEQRQQRSEAARRHLEMRYQMSAIPPRYLTRTFDNYRAVDVGQQKALAACQQFADQFGSRLETGAGLILSGRPGTGKTHLACAIANQVISQGRSALFITVAALVRKIRSTYGNRDGLSEQDVINDFSRVDLLIVDEVGIQRGTDSEEHLLFEVLNDRNSYYKPTILISNLNATQMGEYIGERSMDRMREGGGRFVPFNWESYRTKVAADEDLPTAKGVVGTLQPPRAVEQAVLDPSTEWSH